MIFGLSPFEGLGAAQVAALFLIYFGSFFIRGAFGFGSVTPAILLGALIIPPHHAVLLSLVATLASQIQLLPEGIRDGDWRVARPLLLATLIFIVVGVYLFREIEGEWLILVLGIALGFTVIADIFNMIARLAVRANLRSPLLAFTLSGIAGLITGVTGGGALFFLSVYIRHVTPSPRAFRGTNLLLTALHNFWRFGVVAFAGLVTPTLILEGAILTPLTLVAACLGGRAMGRLSPERFYRAFQLLVLLAAATVIAKGIVALD